MKFARDFKETLATQGKNFPSRRILRRRVERQKCNAVHSFGLINSLCTDFPPHWVTQAIPYGQLKKCLKKVQRELHSLGLDPDTLRALLGQDTTSPVAIEYKLKGNVKFFLITPSDLCQLKCQCRLTPIQPIAATDSNFVRPKLTVFVHLQDGVAVDASLAPTSRAFLEKIAAEINTDHVSQTQEGVKLDRSVSAHGGNVGTVSSSAADAGSLAKQDQCEVIEVPLIFDGEFFDLLQSDVNCLNVLQAEEQKTMSKEVEELGKEVSHVSRPSRFAKSDMARWQQIFELYLDAEVFFGTHERDHGTRSSQLALKHLQWFQREVERRNLAGDFKLGESKVAFSRFVKLNFNLLKNLQFQELNKLAIIKILKSKFEALIASVLREVINCDNQNLINVRLWESRRHFARLFSPTNFSRQISQRTCAHKCPKNLSLLSLK